MTSMFVPRFSFCTPSFRRLIVSLLALATLFCGVSAYAVEGSQVLYVTGTIAAPVAGSVGTLDTTPADNLHFNSSVGAIDIPYAALTDFRYSNELARHLGVVPAIGVGLVRKRERKHYFTLTYTDTAGTAQVVTFEVSKHAPQSLLAILRARAPQVCHNKLNCGVVPQL